MVNVGCGTYALNSTLFVRLSAIPSIMELKLSIGTEFYMLFHGVSQFSFCRNSACQFCLDIYSFGILDWTGVGALHNRIGSSSIRRCFEANMNTVPDIVPFLVVVRHALVVWYQ